VEHVSVRQTSHPTSASVSNPFTAKTVNSVSAPFQVRTAFCEKKFLQRQAYIYLFIYLFLCYSCKKLTKRKK